MAIMFGDGNVEALDTVLRRTVNFKAETDGATLTQWKDITGKAHAVTPTYYDPESGSTVTSTKAGKTYLATFELAIEGQQITVGASTFPGTYYITGDCENGPCAA